MIPRTGRRSSARRSILRLRSSIRPRARQIRADRVRWPSRHRQDHDRAPDRLARRGHLPPYRLDRAGNARCGVPADGIGEAGYPVANAIAEANLLDGRMVVADCVNPLPESREAWRVVALRARVPLVEVEIICTDEVEHRRRVEQRVSEIPGLVLPRWRDVREHNYHPWNEPHVTIDTAGLSPEQAVAAVSRCIPSTRARPFT